MTRKRRTRPTEREPIRLDVIVEGSHLLVPLTEVERAALEDSLAWRSDASGVSEWARRVLLDAAASSRPGYATGSLSKAIDLLAEVETFERTAIVAALVRTGDNQTRAAALLGVSRRALIVKMEKYGLKPKPARRER